MNACGNHRTASSLQTGGLWRLHIRVIDDYFRQYYRRTLQQDELTELSLIRDRSAMSTLALECQCLAAHLNVLAVLVLRLDLADLVSKSFPAGLLKDRVVACVSKPPPVSETALQGLFFTASLVSMAWRLPYVAKHPVHRPEARGKHAPL